MKSLGSKCHLLVNRVIFRMEMAATISRCNILPATWNKLGFIFNYSNVITKYKSFFNNILAERLILRKHEFTKKSQSIVNGNSRSEVGFDDEVSLMLKNSIDELELNPKSLTTAREGNFLSFIKRTNPNYSQKNYLRGLQFRQPFRIFSSGDGPRPKGLPPLMNFPQIVWPSIFKTVRNWILCNTIITPYFDREFNLPDFIAGSKQAVEVVSHAISKGEWDQLNPLVVEETISEIRKSIASFSVQQRQDLAVNKEDIYFSFPYQVGVMFDDEKDKEGVQHRFVEITMCYHVLLGLKELRAQDVSPPLTMGISPEYQDRICICNYRFIREFTKGKEAESEWKVNIVNHFKPSDFVNS